MEFFYKTKKQQRVKQPVQISRPVKRTHSPDCSDNLADNTLVKRRRQNKTSKVSHQTDMDAFLTPDKENVNPMSPLDSYSPPDKENIDPLQHARHMLSQNGSYSAFHRIESPIPPLNFASSQDLWENMLKKDMKYQRNSQYMSRHPDLHSRMRTVLLDWLIEVCEVYALHRETFYLAVNFLDRYLSIMQDVEKNQLQLVGITALFVASKLEEIYPPPLAEFAFVTDSACTEEQILQQELIMLSKLKWCLSPTTPIAWLNTYLQTAHHSLIPDTKTTFIYPQYPQITFANVAQLLDLCILDIECLEFNPAVLAASALYHFSSSELAKHVSGFDYADLVRCIQWVEPFAVAISNHGLAPIKEFNKHIIPTEVHNIQSHANSLECFDSAYQRKVQERNDRASPVEVGGLITPPNSSEKNNTQTAVSVNPLNS